MKIKFILIYIPLLITFSLNSLSAQCTYQVDHTEGTTTINEIQVTATAFGYADIVPISFCGYTEPYMIGWNNDPLPHGDGGYTFQFSPPIDSLNLNFSWINTGNGTEEVVKIYLNGEHYIIPEVMESNSCSDSLAIVTSTGEISGQNNEHHYGGQILIPGPIHEITVLDSFLLGQPLGVSFSLKICSEFTTSVVQNELSDFKIFPNPSKDIITIEGISNQKTTFILFDLLGHPVYIDPIIQGKMATIDIDHLQSGIYYLSISFDDNVTTQKVIIAND